MHPNVRTDDTLYMSVCVCVFECGSSCIFFRASKICFRYGTLNMHAFILNGNVNDATHELETVTYRFYVVYNVEISLYNDTVNKSHPELLTISEMWSLFVSRIFCSALFLSHSHSLSGYRCFNVSSLAQHKLAVSPKFIPCVYAFHKIMELHLKHLTVGMYFC